MMRISLLLLLALLSHSHQISARNPFEAPPDQCQQIMAKWHYRGIIQQGNHLRILLQTHDNQWLRLTTGDTLPGGVKVTYISVTSVTLIAGQHCPAITLQTSHKESLHALATNPAHSVISANITIHQPNRYPRQQQHLAHSG